MSDSNKTKKQLIEELKVLRKAVDDTAGNTSPGEGNETDSQSDGVTRRELLSGWIAPVILTVPLTSRIASAQQGDRAVEFVAFPTALTVDLQNAVVPTTIAFAEAKERDSLQAITSVPTSAPIMNPTMNPTVPTYSPTGAPTSNPTGSPTSSPTSNPTGAPTSNPTGAPTSNPTMNPTVPTSSPTGSPTANPTGSPTTAFPTQIPTATPTTAIPTGFPTQIPTTASPTTAAPTVSPTGLIPVEITDFEVDG